MARQSDSKRIKVRSNLPKAQFPVGLAEIVFLTLSEVFDWMWLLPRVGVKVPSRILCVRPQGRVRYERPGAHPLKSPSRSLTSDQYPVALLVGLPTN
jgi:hypothetical protein